MKRPIDITCKMCGGHGTAYLTKGPSGKASWPVVGVLPPNWAQMAEPEAATYVTTVYFCSDLCRLRYGATHKLEAVDSDAQ